MQGVQCLAAPTESALWKRAHYTTGELMHAFYIGNQTSDACAQDQPNKAHTKAIDLVFCGQKGLTFNCSGLKSTFALFTLLKGSSSGARSAKHSSNLSAFCCCCCFG